MGTIAEKLTYLNGTKTAIKGALQNRGVTVSDTDTFRSYADKVGQIGETVEKTKFGASIDTWIGNVDENETLNGIIWRGALNFVGVKRIGYRALPYTFYERTNITNVDLSSVQSVGEYGMTYAFGNCIGITNVDLSSLQSVGRHGVNYTFLGCKNITNVDLSSVQSVDYYGMSYTFKGCTSLTSIDLSSLQSVGDNGMCNAFEGCTGLTSIDLSSVQSVGESGMYNAFANCTGITTISFPSLTSVLTNSFGISAYNGVFKGCTALAEIHFRADMQTTIEAMSQYANKWGATNATIYFDL